MTTGLSFFTVRRRTVLDENQSSKIPKDNTKEVKSICYISDAWVRWEQCPIDSRLEYSFPITRVLTIFHSFILKILL